MRTDLSLERRWIPDLSHKCAESLDELRLVIKVLEHKVVADRWNVRQHLNNHVDIVVRFDVVQSHKAYEIEP